MARTRPLALLLLGVGLGIAAFAVAVVLWLSPAREPGQSAPAPLTPGPQAAAEPDTSPQAAVQAAPEAAERTTAPAATAAAPSGPRAIVRGRVVDERGTPLPGVEVMLHNAENTWAPGAVVPKVSRNGYEFEAFCAATEPDGRFRFDVPLPTSDWIGLGVEPGPYYGLAGRDFGTAGGRNQPRLVEGDNDLGDIALAFTGAIAGTVVGPTGAALPKARVRLDAFPGGRGVETRCAEDGTFTLGHVPPGAASLEVEAKGFLLARPQSIDVRAQQTTRLPPITLERAPSVSGVVVDERGAPLEGVRVWGWPRSSGRGAGARTAADGAFTLWLPQDEPYALEVRDNPEFEDWGGIGQAQSTFEPGRDDVRIVLKRSTKTTFVVLDAASGAPVPRFGLEVTERAQDGSAWSSFRGPRVADHPDGTVVAGGAPGTSAVGVLAPGFAPFEGDVAHDAGAERRMTIRLARGGSIAGRATHAGAPLAQAAVRLERDLVPIDPKLPPPGEEREEWMDENMHYDVGPLAGSPRTLTAGPDGAFEVPDLAPGSYRVVLSGGKAARTTLRRVRVEAGARVDVGAVELAAGATLRGRVVLGAGLSPVGLEVLLDDDWSRKTGVASADGAFAFQGIEAGRHEVVLRRQPPAVLEEQRRAFQVAAGGSAEVVFDLAASAPARVVARVTRAGRPEAGVRVVWQRTGQERGFERELGRTDAEGVARGVCESGAPGRFVARGAGNLLIAAGAEQTLAPGLDHEVALAVHVGSLMVVLPDSVAVPEQGNLSVDLRRPGEPVVWIGTAYLLTAGATFPAPDASVWKDRRVTVGDVMPGDYIASVHARRQVRVEGQPNAWTFELVVPPHEATITVREGETTVIAVPGAR